MCVSQGGALGRGAAAQVCGDRTERQPHRPVPNSPKEAHKRLAVRQGLGERKWEGREKETELAGAAWGAQFIASPTESSNWLARGILH